MNSKKQTIGDTLTPEKYNEFLKSDLMIPLRIIRCGCSFAIIPTETGVDLYTSLQQKAYKRTFDTAHETFQAIQKYGH